MADWTYLLADLATNAPLAQVPLINVQPPTLSLNTPGTLSGAIPVRYISGDPYRYTTPARTCIYVLRDGVPWWGGIIWTRKYTGSGGAVEIQAADWWSYYDHRFILGPASAAAGGDFSDANAQVGAADPGTTAHGTQSYGYSGGMVGQVPIVTDLLHRAASLQGGDLRLEVYAPTDPGTPRQVEYQNFNLIPYGKALEDLANLSDGPDLMFGVDGWDTTGAPQRCLWIGDPHLVRAPGEVVFTYGGNLLDYTWASDGTQIATRTWALAGESPSIDTMMSRADSVDLINLGWPLLEVKNTYKNILEGQWAQLQQQSASDANAYRKPVVSPSLIVRTDVPPYLDYAPGDQARLLITDDYFRNGLDITVKIIAVAASVTAETAALAINPVDEDIP